MTSALKRIHAYTPEHLHKRLDIACSHPRVSRSEIINKALELYLSAESEAARNNPLVRRLDQMSRQYEKLHQRLVVLSEGHALFVRYFLTSVPPAPKPKRQAARAEGAVRFNDYRKSLELILSDRNKHLFNGIEDVFLAESDFFTDEDLDALDIPATDSQSGGENEQS